MLPLQVKEDLKWAMKRALVEKTLDIKSLNESNRTAANTFILKEATYEQLLNLTFNPVRETKYISADLLECLAIDSISKMFNIPVISESEKIKKNKAHAQSAKNAGGEVATGAPKAKATVTESEKNKLYKTKNQIKKTKIVENLNTVEGKIGLLEAILLEVEAPQPQFQMTPEAEEAMMKNKYGGAGHTQYSPEEQAALAAAPATSAAQGTLKSAALNRDIAAGTADKLNIPGTQTANTLPTEVTGGAEKVDVIQPGMGAQIPGVPQGAPVAPTMWDKMKGVGQDIGKYAQQAGEQIAGGAKQLGGAIQKNPGIAAATLATGAGAYFLFKRFMSKAARACAGQPDKNNCMKLYKANGIKQTIGQLNSTKKQCAGDQACIQKLDTQIASWQQKLQSSVV